MCCHFHITSIVCHIYAIYVMGAIFINKFLRDSNFGINQVFQIPLACAEFRFRALFAKQAYYAEPGNARTTSPRELG